MADLDSVDPDKLRFGLLCLWKFPPYILTSAAASTSLQPPHPHHQLRPRLQLHSRLGIYLGAFPVGLGDRVPCEKEWVTGSGRAVWSVRC